MYGILISSAIIVCLLVGESIAKKESFNLNLYWKTTLFTIVCGLIGGRLYHVVDYYQYYFANPQKILAINEGGMGIYGAILGGIAAFYGASKVYKFDFWRWLGVGSIVLPLGQAIGRWGNYFNNELFGYPTNLPWGIFIPKAYRPEEYLNNDVFHPLFLYESLLSLALFVVLYRRFVLIGVHNKTSGKTYTLVYLLCYGAIRFSLDFLRINPWKINNINISQLISVIFIIIGIVGLLRIRKLAAPLSK